MSNEVQPQSTAGASAPLPATPSGVRAELAADQGSSSNGAFAAHPRTESAPLPATPAGIRAELIALQERDARAAARRAQLLREAALHQGWGQTDDPREVGLLFSAVGMELAPALRMHPRAMENRVSEAVMLLEQRPVVFRALEAGSITQAHVDQIRRHTSRLLFADLPPGQLEQIDGVIVELAERLTPSELVRALKQIVEEFLPESLAERNSRANEDRFVELDMLEDGMAQLRIVAQAYLLTGVKNRLDETAREVENVEREQAKAVADGDAAATDCYVPDDRTRNQIRTDVAIDLLLSNTASAVPDSAKHIHASIDVSIDADVLTTDEHVLRQAGLLADLLHGTAGADPDGYHSVLTGTVDGYVPVFVARDLSSCSTSWQRLFQDADTKALLTVDNYVPTAAQRRLIETRDQHCRFPGCRQPLQGCDADHSTAYAEGGETKVSNLAMLCRRHHTMKHAAGWAIRHLGGGKLEWISPQGHHYTSTPERTVAFTTIDDEVSPADVPVPGDSSVPRPSPSLADPPTDHPAEELVPF